MLVANIRWLGRWVKMEEVLKGPVPPLLPLKRNSHTIRICRGGTLIPFTISQYNMGRDRVTTMIPLFADSGRWRYRSCTGNTKPTPERVLSTMTRKRCDSHYIIKCQYTQAALNICSLAHTTTNTSFAGVILAPEVRRISTISNFNLHFIPTIE